MNIPLYGVDVAPVQAIQAPLVSPGTAGAPGAAIAKVGADVQELSAHIQAKVDEVRRTEELSSRALQVESETADLMVELEKKKDPATVADDYYNGFQDIKERALDGVNDMKVANALTSHLATREATDTVKVKHQSWAWTIEQGQEAVQTDTDQMIKNHTSSMDVANPDPLAFAKASDDIQARINASVESGILKPEVGRALYEKKRKDLYIQAAYRAIIDDPQGAPVKVMSILLPSGLDPKDIEEIHRTAIIRRESSETGNHKQDEVRWEQNAVTLDLDAREGRLNPKQVVERFKSGDIGPAQAYRLQNVIDSHGLQSNEASQDLMYSILNRMYTGQATPQETKRAIQNASGSIKPGHQTHAYTVIAAIGGGGGAEKIPATMTRAERLIQTMVYPSLGSPSPKASEGKKYGELMSELYGEYFGNRAKYHSDPDALIKWSMSRISPKAGGSAVAPPSPYNSKEELKKAYNYYVIQGKGNSRAPRNYWNAWFLDEGMTLPGSPGGK